MILRSNINVPLKQIQAARKKVLLLKENLQKLGPIKPNSLAYRQYQDTLMELCVLTTFQLYCLVGLILSDASLQLSMNGKNNRLKTQQSNKREVLMNHLVQDVFPEWTLQTKALPVSEKRSDMLSLQSMTLPIFNSLRQAFYINKTKVVTQAIADLLHPIALAYWFAGDGGKYDYREVGAKGLAFHTQGFDKASIDLLVAALIKRYGWEVQAKKQSGATDQWWIKINDYDDFVLKVGPYIHPSIISKLPSARADNSRHGIMNKALFDQVCGSFFKEKGPKYKG